MVENVNRMYYNVEELQNVKMDDANKRGVKLRKHIKIAIYTFLFLSLILILVYCYPRRINREYNGFMYQLGDHTYSEIIKISINGYITNGLIQGDKFKGSIIVGNTQLQKLDMRFDSYGRGLLFYYDDSTGDYTSYGDMYVTDNMNELTICVLEEDEDSNGGKSWSAKDGLMISAVAGNRNEALAISNNLMKDVLININLE